MTLRRPRSLFTDIAGVTAMEFAFIASLISVAIIGGVNSLGAKAADMWAGISNAI